MSRKPKKMRKIKSRNDYRQMGYGTDLDVHLRVVHKAPRPELFLLPRETIYAAGIGDEVESTYQDMMSLDLAHLPYSHCIIGVPGDIVFRSSMILKSETDIEVTLPTSDKSQESLRIPKGLSLDTANGAFRILMSGWEECANNSRDWEFRFHFFDEKFYRPMARFSPVSPWKNMSLFSVKDSSVPEREREAAVLSFRIRMEATAGILRKILIVLLATRNAIKVRTKDKLLALGIGSRKAQNNTKPLYTTTIHLPSFSEEKKANEPTGRTVAPHLRRGHIRKQAWGPHRSFHKSIWIEPCFVNADPTYISTRVSYNTSL